MAALASLTERLVPPPAGPDGAGTAEGPGSEWLAVDKAAAVAAYGQAEAEQELYLDGLAGVPADGGGGGTPVLRVDGEGEVGPSSINLAMTMLAGGSATIMAQVCLNSGIALFLVLLAGLGFVAQLTLGFLAKVIEEQRLAGVATYGKLCGSLLGPRHETGMRAVILTNQLGACVFIVVLMADVFVPIFGSLGASNVLCRRWLWQLLLTAGVLYPLTLPRTMHRLRYLTGFALVVTVAAMLGIVVYGAAVLAHPADRLAFDTVHNGSALDRCTAARTRIPPSGSLARALPAGASFALADSLAIISFAYLCHMNVFPIHRELRAPTVPRFQAVARLAVGMSCLVFAGYGVFGYLLFLDATQPNLLTNFPVSGSLVAHVSTALRALFGLAVMCSFPIIAWEARAGVEAYLFGGRPGSFRRHALVNLGLCALVLLLGVLIPTIDIVVGFIGATCAPVMAYAAPSLLFLKSPLGAAGARRWSTRFVASRRRLPLIGTVSLPTGEHVAAAAIFYASTFVLMPLSLVAWVALLVA